MLLLLIFCILFISLFCILFLDGYIKTFEKAFVLICSGLCLILSTFLLVLFDENLLDFQSLTTLSVGSSLLNINFLFGLDGISILFFFLSSLLIFLCIIFIWEDPLFKFYSVNLMLIELFLLIIFSVLDLFLFYVFFEAILIPMYLIVGVWGSRERKIRAAYLFFFFTLCGSILFLLGILYIYSVTGTSNLEYIMSYNFNTVEQNLLWLTFFLSFASKIPMFPFHIWLPEAHVEAPTVGSVLLAGILLKLGVYGFLRFSLPLFPDACLFYSPLVYLFSIIGILYASFCAIRQTDLKRIIAYSSIAHMNLVTLGIFSFNLLGIEGSILQSISHGFVSGGMFFLIGILYDRYHSRFLYYYGGVVHYMPLYSMFFLIFTMANIALPGTSSFVGEFLLLMGIYSTSSLTSIIAALGVILCGCYSLWLCNKLLFGNLKLSYTLKFSDINLKEFLILLPLFFFIILVGVYPSAVTFYINFSTLSLLF
jgi:proton-translocating NADH-quinone oxidoreductase chain M